MPKVSICIPTYNQPWLFKRTLKSILEQSYTDYEIIITDDSNNNSIKKIIDEFLPNQKIKYYKNNKRVGSPKNWNTAIKLASGEYIKILHHDDWFSDKNSLDEFVKMLDENLRVDFAFCSSNIVNQQQNKTSIHIPTQDQLKILQDEPSHLFFGNFIGAPSSTIYRRKISTMFDINLKWLVDVDFYINILNLNNLFIFSKKPLINTTDGSPHQITNECINNKCIELFEYIYIYNKICHRKKNHKLFYFIFFLNLFKKYEITSEKDFIACKQNLIIPKEIKILLIIQGFFYYPINKIEQWAKKLVKKIIPIRYLYRKIHYFILYLNFRKDFIKFKKSGDHKKRGFSISWKERMLFLNDKSENTPFDAHYIYHPAWAARVLAETKPQSHTDISSILNFSTIISAFIPTKFYDYRPVNLKLRNLTSEKADLQNLPFEDASIASLSCMHTIEHIGLGRYGDKIDPDGDFKAMLELKRVLAYRGNLLFVVPIGKPKILFNAHRIYSYEQILSYFSDLKLKEFSLIPDNASNVGMIYNATKELADKQNYGCGCFWFKK